MFEFRFEEGLYGEVIALVSPSLSIVNPCVVAEKIKAEEAERWLESAWSYPPSRKDFVVDCVIIVRVC